LRGEALVSAQYCDDYNLQRAGIYLAIFVVYMGGKIYIRKKMHNAPVNREN